MRTEADWKWYFVFVLPVVWGGFSLLQHRFPGDEYGLYAVGSIAGVWILFFVPDGDVNSVLFPLRIALAGMAVMAFAGLILDLLKAHRIAFWCLWVVGVVALFLIDILSYPSLERAIAKNGSLWAYLLAAANLSLYASGLLVLAGALLMKLWRRLSGGRKDVTSVDG